MNRRLFLAASASASLTVGLAGCASLFDASMPDDLEAVESDRQLPVPTLSDGDVPVDVYEDLGCPACQEFQAEVFPTLEAELIEPDEIAYRHFDFVVEAADQSLAMANAARAVQSETHDGDDEPNGAFFEYKNAVMRGDDHGDEALAALAEDVDVDPAVVSSALEEESYYPTLVADWERGEAAGVEGTPTVVVDDEIVEDSMDPDAIIDAVDDAS